MTTEPETVMETFAVRWVDDRGNIRPPYAVQSGIESLDFFMRGFRPGELIIVAGHPVSGKTSFLLTVMHELMRKNIPVAYGTAQSRRFFIGRKFLSFAFGMNAWAMTQKEYGPEGEKVIKTLADMRSWPGYVVDLADKPFSIESMLECFSGLMEKVSLRLLMIDDPQRMKEKEMDIVIRLKHFAVDRQVPVLIALKVPEVLPMSPRRIMEYLEEVAVYTDYILTLDKKEPGRKEKKQLKNRVHMNILDLGQNYTFTDMLEHDIRLGKFSEMK